MIYAKLLKLQELKLAVEKKGKNPFTKSNYVTLDDLINTYRQPMSDVQVVAYHAVKESVLTTYLYDTEDNTYVETTFNLPETADPQKIGSSLTYGKRYNLGLLLNIVTDEDDDGNTGTKEAKENKAVDSKKKGSQRQGPEKPEFTKEVFEKFKQSVVDGSVDADTYDKAIILITSKYNIFTEVMEELKAFYMPKPE